jgi:hypothetical protein
MYQETLTEIANRYGTDKGTAGPSERWPARNYTDTYDGYLSTMRSEPVRLLEIGLGVRGPRWDSQIVHGLNDGGGASIKMWQDYFPNGEILGIDINDANYLNSERIQTYVVDQGSKAELEKFLRGLGDGQFDIVIDDGSHRADHQQLSFGLLFPRLKTGGLYFIEDLLNNGRGDGATGGLACETVYNTRRIFREYRASRKFPEPHGIANADYVARHIAEIGFHNPNFRLQQRPSPETTKQSGELSVRYFVGTEGLCAIRKTKDPAS